MPLTSSVVNQSITNFKLYFCSKKFQMLQKNVKSLLEQLKVCIFAEIVFGVRCTLRNGKTPPVLLKTVDLRVEMSSNFNYDFCFVVEGIFELGNTTKS